MHSLLASKLRSQFCHEFSDRYRLACVFISASLSPKLAYLVLKVRPAYAEFAEELKSSGQLVKLLIGRKL